MSKRVRPDIVIEKGEETYIIDTKWKLPQNGRPSDDDLKQIYVYNKLWKAKRGILLYPEPINGIKNVSGAYNQGDGVFESEQTGEMQFISVLDEDRKLKKGLGLEILESLALIKK